MAFSDRQREIINVVSHYQRKIVKYADLDAEVLLHALGKLGRVKHMSIALLAETGIGKTVNGLKRHADARVATQAKTLVTKWKEAVAIEEALQHQNDEADGEEIDDRSSPLKAADLDRHEVVAAQDKPHGFNGSSSTGRDVKGRSSHKSKHGKAKGPTRADKSEFAAALDQASTSLSKSQTSSPAGTKRPAPPLTDMVKLNDIRLPLPSLKTDYKPSPGATTAVQQTKTNGRIDPVKMGANFQINKSRTITAVYSGMKRTGYFGEVPTLFNLCIRVLQEYVDCIEECGNLDYTILEPVLRRASPQTLMKIEEFNPHLMEDTGPIWEHLVKKKFPLERRQEMESPREMYERCCTEQEDKFARLQARFKKSYRKMESETKKTKLAFVDAVAKPPRSALRAQLKHGTHVPAGTSITSTGPSTTSSSVATRPVPIAPSKVLKPKVAPMMAKTLRMVKSMNGYRR